MLENAVVLSVTCNRMIRSVQYRLCGTWGLDSNRYLLLYQIIKKKCVYWYDQGNSYVFCFIHKTDSICITHNIECKKPQKSQCPSNFIFLGQSKTESSKNLEVPHFLLNDLLIRYSDEIWKLLWKVTEAVSHGSVYLSARRFQRCVKYALKVMVLAGALVNNTSAWANHLFPLQECPA